MKQDEEAVQGHTASKCLKHIFFLKASFQKYTPWYTIYIVKMDL